MKILPRAFLLLLAAAGSASCDEPERERADPSTPVGEPPDPPEISYPPPVRVGDPATDGGLSADSATATCSPSSCPLCSPDVCERNWTQPFADRLGRGLRAGPDGAVYALTDRQITRFDARDGTPTPIVPRSVLANPQTLVVAPDSTLWVADQRRLDGGLDTYLEHLDGRGELLGSLRHQVYGLYATMSAAPDGQIYVLSQGSLGLLQLDRLQGTSLMVMFGPLQTDAFGAPLPNNLLNDMRASQLAFGESGAFAIALEGDRSWLLFSDGKKPGASLQLTNPNDASNSGVVHALASDGAGGYYVAYEQGRVGWDFSVQLRRVRNDGSEMWRRAFTLKDAMIRPRQGPSFGGGPLLGMAVLTDSVVFSVIPVPNGAQPIMRFGSDGSLLATLHPAGYVAALTRTGDSSIAFVATEDPSKHGSKTELHHVTFTRAQATPKALGESCNASDQCASSLCCISVKTSQGSCAADSCPLDARCSSAMQCASGSCLLPDGGAEGVCTAPCSASASCPAAHHCVLGHCRASCATAAHCPGPAASCGEATNVEMQTVLVCR